MKFALFLLIITMVHADPAFEEARAALASPQMTVREKATRELWKNGTGSLPLLEKLARDADPEVALRADFVRRRLRMGLHPGSPNDLLGLAENLEYATPEKRISRLQDLLDHADGAPSALIILDQWARQKIDQPERFVTLARLVTESLLERRKDWQKFFTWQLSPQCRAAMIVEIARQDLPMQSQMIAILGKNDTAEIYQNLQKFTDTISEETRIALARVSILNREISLALTLLKDGLAQSSDTRLVRSLAFLEKTSGVALGKYEGPRTTELEVFRARLNGEFEKLPDLNLRIKKQPILRYENNLLSGNLSLPSENNGGRSLFEETALNALHESFGNPSRQPDIEALASAVLIDWTVLARTLTLLGSPIEAAEILSSNDQITSAIGVLWRSNHRQKALDLAAKHLDGLDESLKFKVRITIAKLHLEAGEKEEAAKVFEPLLYLQVHRDDHRRIAIKLGLQLFPRDQLISLAPDLRTDQPYRRASAISDFLPFPDKVSVTWYEHFLKEEPLQSPAGRLSKVEKFLNNDLDQARALISRKFRTSSKKILLPTDSLYQNALFLRLPKSPDMVRKAAWYQLNTSDLAHIITDESWPLETRKEALKTALLIDPVNPALRWHDSRLNQKNSPQTLLEMTLGHPALVLQLGALTGKREPLQNAAAVADIKDTSATRILTILAKSYLKNNEAKPAARYLQTALCGEIAAGSQPATPIKTTLENLKTYCQARAAIAKNKSEKTVWADRLKAFQ